MDGIAKITIFCDELGDTVLLELAKRQGMEGVLQRAKDALKAGDASPMLEADLDALDEMVKQETGQRLFLVSRGYSPLPPYQGGSGAQWWTCPIGRCAGRGRVKAGQPAPVCAATSEQLVARPLAG